MPASPVQRQRVGGGEEQGRAGRRNARGGIVSTGPGAPDGWGKGERLPLCSGRIWWTAGRPGEPDCPPGLGTRICGACREAGHGPRARPPGTISAPPKKCRCRPTTTAASRRRRKKALAAVFARLGPHRSSGAAGSSQTMGPVRSPVPARAQRNARPSGTLAECNGGTVQTAGLLPQLHASARDSDGRVLIKNAEGSRAAGQRAAAPTRGLGLVGDDARGAGEILTDTGTYSTPPSRRRPHGPGWPCCLRPRRPEKAHPQGRQDSGA